MFAATIKPPSFKLHEITRVYLIAKEFGKHDRCFKLTQWFYKNQSLGTP